MYNCIAILKTVFHISILSRLFGDSIGLEIYLCFPNRLFSPSSFSIKMSQECHCYFLQHVDTVVMYLVGNAPRGENKQTKYCIVIYKRVCNYIQILQVVDTTRVYSSACLGYMHIV